MNYSCDVGISTYLSYSDPLTTAVAITHH